MSEDKGKSSDFNHEFRNRDKEFDSVLDVIKGSNIDPHLFLPKRIIGEIDSSDSEFNSTKEFEKRLAKVCAKETKEDPVNFNFDLLSMCGKEIIDNKYRSINFDKAALLLESSAQVYSGKVDHLHSLASKELESIHQKGEPEQPMNVLKQTEEDDMEVDPDCTLEDTATSSINLVKPPADVVLEGEGLDAAGKGLDGAGDRGQLQSSTIAKRHLLYRQLPLQNLSDDEAPAEFLKGIDSGSRGKSQSSEPSDDVVQPADGGYLVPEDMHEDDSAYYQGDPDGSESPVPDAKIEEPQLPKVDSPPFANISGSEKQEEQLDANVSLWNQRIEQHLEELGERPAFDVNDYGEIVLKKLCQSADLKNAASFADVVQGETKHDVARSFTALLQLANDGSVDLQRSDTTDEEFPSENALSVRLLRHAKRRQEVQLESSKKRAASQMTIGESSKDKSGSSGKENSEPLATNDNSPFSDWKTVGDLK